MSDLEKTRAAVVDAIGEVAAVSVEDLRGNSRRRGIVFCRFIVARELYNRTSMDYEALSDWMGKDVGTIAYYLRRYEDDYRTFPRFRKMADKIGGCVDGKV